MDIEKKIIRLVKDLENTSYKYHRYAYARTIRNILTANSNSPVIVNFINKDYCGIFKYLSIQNTTLILDEMVRRNLLGCYFTDRGKRYYSVD